MDDPSDAEELAAAEELDREIARVLVGSPPRTSDPTVLWLTTSMRPDPPSSLTRRLAGDHARREHRRWRPVQVAAAALAAMFLTHGLGSLLNGDWVARNLDEHYSAHAFQEGGLALLAIGVVVAAGALRRRWVPLAVAAGAPLGAAYGVVGVGEIGRFTGGAVFHSTQGAVGIVLAVLWWRAHRYGRASGDEGGA